MKPFLAFLGPRGVGTSTILRELCTDSAYEHIRPVTTRPQREDDWDRECITRTQFHARNHAGTLYVKNQVYDEHWYAFDKSRVLSCNEREVTPVVDIAPHFLPQLRYEHRTFFSAQPVVPIMILPPSAEEFERRLRASGRFNEAGFRVSLQWLRNAEEDTSIAARVVNNSLPEAVERVRALAQAYATNPHRAPERARSEN